MASRRSYVVRVVRPPIEARVRRMTDYEVVVALSLMNACDEPLRAELGIKGERDADFVRGIGTYLARWSAITKAQRRVVEQMVVHGLVSLKLRADREQTRRALGIKPSSNPT